MSPFSTDDKVTIALTITPPFRIVHARLIDSIHPGKSVTIAINDTVLKETHATEGLGAVLRIGAFGPSFISTRDANRAIRFGVIKPHYSEPNVQKPDLRERGFCFLTLPGSDEDVTVTHTISSDRLLESSDLQRNDVQAGEMFKFIMSEGRMQPQWWCWGNLDGDMKRKNLHVWAKGGNYLSYYEELPSEEDVDEDNFVLGEDADKIRVEDRTGCAEVKMID